jgi:pyruvate dehydrogenase E1 component alpha subunit
VACFFGDGASCQGRFHESLNLAAVWGPPVLYVCENNHWQAFVHRDETMLVKTISSRAVAYGIEGRTVDGIDVAAVHEARKGALARTAETGRPFLLKAVSYRLRGHFEPDDLAYVDAAELASWRERDSIEALRDRLIGDGHLTGDEFLGLEARATARIDEAIAFAEASPFPATEALTSLVHA